MAGMARRTTAGLGRTIDLDDAAAWARSCRALLRPSVASATPAVAPTSFTNRRLAPGASAGLFRFAENAQKSSLKTSLWIYETPRLNEARSEAYATRARVSLNARFLFSVA